LFVGGRLISETGMANHPLTPMRDPDLVRVLGRQVGGAEVGLIDHTILTRADAAAAIAAGPRYLIADSIDDADLALLAKAASTQSFATGGSAFGAAFAQVKLGEAASGSTAFPMPDTDMPVAVLAGSCSEATLRQIAAVPPSVPHLRMEAEAVAADPQLSAKMSSEANALLANHAAILISSSSDAASLAAVQSRLGRDEAGAMIERSFADIADKLFAAGQRIFIVAGGETSGAVVERLGSRQLLIGPEIAPGVPWCYSDAGGGLWLALKSGNFGGEHFFADAAAVLGREAA
jgi:3-dehydrotetronate 4-kinase